MIERLTTAFETERLTIRRVELRDLEGLLTVHSHDDVTRFLPYDTWKSMDDATAWFERISLLDADGRSRQFVMIERADAGARERPVGAIVLFNVDAGNLRGEVGYVLGRADWGRGLMREALTTFLTHVFDDLGLRRIEAFVDPRNRASHRLATSLGFVHEGMLRERSSIKGQVADSNVYGLLVDEWRSRSVR
jgi:RimJ/RimL family protein N-acetyltransferase